MSVSLAALDQKFAVLDELPDALYATIITHPHGELLIRTRGILQWREALLEGRLPEQEELCWPDTEMRLVVLKRLEVLEIVKYCQGQEELTDSVLLDICEGISTAEEYYQYKPGGFVDKLAQRQKIRDRDSPFSDEEGLADHVENNGPSDQNPAHTESVEVPPIPVHTEPDAVSPNPAHTEPDAVPPNPARTEPDAVPPNPARTEPAEVSPNAVRTEPVEVPPNSVHTEPVEVSPTAVHTELVEVPPTAARTEPVEVPPTRIIDKYLQRRWQELAEHWHEMEEVFAAFSGQLGRGWDLTQGMLAAQGWRDIIRYRKLVKNSAELKALIKTLGRFRETSGDAENSPLVSLRRARCERDTVEQIMTPLERMIDQEQDVITPRIVMETGGLERSDELARQLPSELALLGHPKLKMLWHARRAERMLMTYAYRGMSVDRDRVHEQRLSDSQEQDTRPDPGLGPIIVCLDTSGSMHGEPEHIAKALVLEALIIASREQRACYVYSFGGPQEVIEHELNLGESGLNGLLDFLQMSFHGGTDVTTPLFMAMQRQQREGWQQADILLVSDGRFPARPELFSRLRKMKQKQGLRVHGLLLGNWRSTAIEQICEPLHRFNEWQEIPAGLH